MHGNTKKSVTYQCLLHACFIWGLEIQRSRGPTFKEDGGKGGKGAKREGNEITPNSQSKYTVSQKKTRHLTLAHKFTKYWPIFKFFSLLDSVGNL